VRPPGSAVIVDLSGAKEFGGGSGGKGLAPSIAHFSVATIRENRTEAIEQSPRWSKKNNEAGFFASLAASSSRCFAFCGSQITKIL